MKCLDFWQPVPRFPGCRCNRSQKAEGQGKERKPQLLPPPPLCSPWWELSQTAGSGTCGIYWSAEASRKDARRIMRLPVQAWIKVNAGQARKLLDWSGRTVGQKLFIKPRPVYVHTETHCTFSFRITEVLLLYIAWTSHLCGLHGPKTAAGSEPAWEEKK